MSRTKHPRKVAWNKRYAAGAMKATIQSPKGTTIEYLGPLSDEQFEKIFVILFPVRNKKG